MREGEVVWCEVHSVSRPSLRIRDILMGVMGQIDGCGVAASRLREDVVYIPLF